MTVSTIRITKLSEIMYEVGDRILIKENDGWRAYKHDATYDTLAEALGKETERQTSDTW